ncbi:hypothetical protein ACGFS9_05355 [Streptomyces sp. NPDC048566]|uniref:hypothetical protein n=1 Tax=Streptomyces sp. NPDC048566 TaxID=3365569 RepID=UPI0037187149
MLRIHDARTGDLIDVASAGRGLVRVHARVDRFDATALRVLLCADVLVRALEIGGTPAHATLSTAAGPADAARLRERAGGLGVRPFEEHHGPETEQAATRTVEVSAAGGTGNAAVRCEVAPVAAGGPPAPGVPDPDDPTDLRLALLASARSAPLRLDAAALEDAGSTLKRWRAAVAGWATEPSRPVPDEVRRRLRAAWEDDLDVPAVLGVLRWIETSDLAAGARFESCAFADRLLGLELTREIGSVW